MSLERTGNNTAESDLARGRGVEFYTSSDFPCFSGFAAPQPQPTVIVQHKRLNQSAKNRRRLVAKQNTIRRLARVRNIGQCIQRTNAVQEEQLYNLIKYIRTFLATDLMQHFLMAVNEYQALASMALARSPVEPMDVDEIGSFSYTLYQDYRPDASTPMPFNGCFPAYPVSVCFFLFENNKKLFSYK